MRTEVKCECVTKCVILLKYISIVNWSTEYDAI